MQTRVGDELINDQSLVVVDAGARNGFQLIPQLHSRIELFAFEPDPISFEPLQEKYAANHSFRRVDVSALALSDQSGEASFYAATHPSMSSLLKPDETSALQATGRMVDAALWAKQLATRQIVTVQTETIDYWANKQQLSYIDFLKLDTQGSELSILHGAADLLRNKQIGVVFTEVSFVSVYQQQCSFSEVDLWMRHCGYRLVDIKTFTEITDYLNRSSYKRIAEQPRAGMHGDAIYIPADKASLTKPASVALILAALGYFSQSEYILKEHQLLGDLQIESLFQQLAQRSFRERFQHFLRRVTPPFLHYWYSRLKV